MQIKSKIIFKYPLFLQYGRKSKTKKNCLRITTWFSLERDYKIYEASVSKVKVTVDLSVATVYLSIFPNDKGKELLEGIKSNAPLIKHEIAQRTKHQLRRMPKLTFFIDDSLEYMDQIEQSLKGKENPIKDPSILDKRKKS